MTPPPPVRQRLTAGERREQVVAVALRRFAHEGFHGTSTEDIAADAGLSQPYLFRLFRTKRDLFLACCEENTARILAAFRAAVDGVPPGKRLTAMGQAYLELLEADEALLRFQLQMYAACADGVIRERSREGWRELVDATRELAGVPEEELWRFFATGMLLNVIHTLDLRSLAADVDWVAQWTDPESELHDKT